MGVQMHPLASACGRPCRDTKAFGEYFVFYGVEGCTEVKQGLKAH